MGVVTGELLLVFALFNGALVAVVLLRRLVKQRLFALKDERRLRWARTVEEVLARGAVPERVPSLRFGWERAAAEAALLDRLGAATPSDRHTLHSLFHTWGLFATRRARLRRGGKWGQAHSALILGRMQCHEVVRDLLWLLERGRADTHLAVVNALELLGQPEAIEGLVNFLSRRGTRQTRPVLSALIRCARGAPQRLLPYLDHRLPLVRTMVASALAEVASSREVAKLIEAASDQEPEVRAQVARALGRTGQPRALQALERLSADPFWYVRLQAVEALPKIRVSEVHYQLLEATRDKHLRVREKAAASLYKVVSDPVYLLGRMQEELGDRYAVEALIAVLEREGVTWEAINRVCSPIAITREKSQDLLGCLLRAGKFACALYALEMHPEPTVRREVLRLLKEHAGSAARVQLRTLVHSQRLDGEMRREIDALLAPQER